MESVKTVRWKGFGRSPSDSDTRAEDWTGAGGGAGCCFDSGGDTETLLGFIERLRLYLLK